MVNNQINKNSVQDSRYFDTDPDSWIRIPYTGLPVRNRILETQKHTDPMDQDYCKKYPSQNWEVTRLCKIAQYTVPYLPYYIKTVFRIVTFYTDPGLWIRG
jgi:hypothetical protein